MEFVDKLNFKKKTTTNKSLKEIEMLNIVELDTEIYMRDTRFSTKKDTVDLHPNEGTHCVAYMNEKILFVMILHHRKSYQLLSLKEIWKTCSFQI